MTQTKARVCETDKASSRKEKDKIIKEKTPGYQDAHGHDSPHEFLKVKKKMSGRSSCNASVALHSFPFPPFLCNTRPSRCHRGADTMRPKPGASAGVQGLSSAPRRGEGGLRLAPRGARRTCSSAQTPQECTHMQRDRGSGGRQRRPRTTWAETNTQPRRQKESAHRQLKKKKDRKKAHDETRSPLYLPFGRPEFKNSDHKKGG